MEKELINYIQQNKEKHYRLAFSYVKNKEDALDIIQDTIVKALKYQDSLQNPAYLGTWFYRILLNTCKSYIKKERPNLYMENEMLDSYIQPAYDSHESFELMDVLEQLSYNEKSIILLRYFNDLELKEIAEIMDLNLSTVKSLLYRSLKKIKTII